MRIKKESIIVGFDKKSALNYFSVVLKKVTKEKFSLPKMMMEEKEERRNSAKRTPRHSKTNQNVWIYKKKIMKKKGKRQLAGWEEFLLKIRAHIDHVMWPSLEYLETNTVGKMLTNLIDEQLEKKGLDKKGMRVYDWITVSENPRDKIANICAFQLPVGTPLLIIQIIQHERLWANKKKCLEFRKRFPEAEIFIYEYGAKKRNRWEFGTKWFKLTKDEFVEGDNHCAWLDVDFCVDEKTLNEMRKIMENHNREVVETKIMYQIAQFVEANSEKKNKLGIAGIDIYCLAFGKSEKRNGEENFVPDLFVYVAAHNDLDWMKKKYEVYEKNYPQAELLVFEYATKEGDRWEYRPRWHRFEKGEWKDADGYCERIGKKIELDEKEFL